MIKIENIQVFNIEGAVRGMRNPMNSWDKSDSGYEIFPDDKGFLTEEKFVIGEADMKLAHNLCVAGHPHRKYLRQIFVSMDITAPRYFWTQFDTYKVGTTKNSCSTMHKIHSENITIHSFSHEYLTGDEDLISYADIDLSTSDVLDIVVKALNALKDRYNTTKDKSYWYQIIQLLPQGFNQRATVTFDYENIVNMVQWRSGHKLDEWVEFCKIMLDKLPYLKEILNGSNE